MSVFEASGDGWTVAVHTEHHWDVTGEHLPAAAVLVAYRDDEPVVFHSPAEMRKLAGAILSAAGELERLQ